MQQLGGSQSRLLRQWALEEEEEEAAAAAALLLQAVLQGAALAPA
jgi:hypothetical protein